MADDEPEDDTENSDEEEEGRGEVGGDVDIETSASELTLDSRCVWGDGENLKTSPSSLIVTSRRGEGEREPSNEESESDESEAQSGPV